MYLAEAEFNYVTVNIGEKFTIDTTISFKSSDKSLYISGEVINTNPSILYVLEVKINGTYANLSRKNNLIMFETSIDANISTQINLSVKIISLAGNDTFGTIIIQNLKINEEQIENLLSNITIKNPYFNDYYVRLAWIDNIYPVPISTNEKLNIIFNIDYASNCEIYLFDISGKNTNSYQLGLCPSGLNHKIIYLDKQIPAGLYYLFLKTPTGEDSKKIMLIK